MKDPTEHYKEIVDRAEKRAEGIKARAKALVPTYGRGEKKLTREEQRRDYLLARSTPETPSRPSGMRLKLRGWRQESGLREAVFDFIEWDKENRG